MTSSFDHTFVDCLDCVPLSTFLCEYYLWYRKAKRARAIPLDKINEKVGKYDLAVNIHSFPECPISSIKSWLDLIKCLKIPYLFIVGHHIPLESHENGNPPINFYDLIIDSGFKEKVFQYKIGDDKVWQNDAYVGFSPFYLFERKW
jgi:hypothetical protein